METTPDTSAGRLAALVAADANSRIEGMRRNPASDPIFAAWVKGNLTHAQVGEALDAQRERDAHPTGRVLAATG